MSATGHNPLTIGRGEIKAHIFTVDNPPVGGLSGLTFRLYVYASQTSTVALLAKSVGFSVIESNVVEMAWEVADTAGLTPGVYYYVLLETAQNLCLSFGALTVRHGIPTTVTSSTPTPFGVVYGGTEADLSATGPGFVQQGATGAPLSLIPYAFTAANTGAFDCTGANRFARTLDGTNGTLSVTGDRVGQAFEVRLTQDGVGAHAVTYSGMTIKWLTSDFNPPTLGSGAGAVTVLLFQKTGTGTYDGYFLGSSGV